MEGRRMYVLVALVIVLATATAPGAQPPNRDEVVSISIGGQTLHIPIPKGFVETSSAPPVVRFMAERSTPPAHRLLAHLVPDSDLRDFVAGGSPRFDRYMLAHTNRAYEGLTVSSADFAQVREGIKRQQPTAPWSMDPTLREWIERSFRDLSVMTGLPAHIDVGTGIPLGVIDEAASSVTIGHIAKTASRIGPIEHTRTTASLSSIAAPRGRFLILVVVTTLESAADIQWARQTMQQWLTDVSRENR